MRSHSLGISTGNALSYEPALGVFNESALAAADYAISVAATLGLKLVVPLTDNYHYYHGGKHGELTRMLFACEAALEPGTGVLRRLYGLERRARV